MEGVALMDITTFAMRKKKAHTLWKEYVAAVKHNKKDEYLKDMKAVYNQLKSGKKLVDIQTVFERGGINDQNQPKLAIALGSSKQCFCRYTQQGRIMFSHKSFGWDSREDVIIRGMPKLPDSMFTANQRWELHKDWQCPVPMIPASVRPPKKDMKHYYVLWEVDQWKPIPPRDPFLLRRITPNMFVVVAAWNLTELERAVMKGRVH